MKISASSIIAFSLCGMALLPAKATSRLDGFALRLSNAEQRIEKRRVARQSGEDGGDVLFGTRAEARLSDAIRRYEEIVRKGGWQSVPKGKSLRRGDKDTRVPQIRRHLVLTGDLDQTKQSDAPTIDQYLHDAIVRFQTRHGLPNEGIAGNLTLAAMNVRAEVRLTQLRKNLERTRAMARLINTTGQNVVVNIPGYELQAVSGDQVKFSSRVIVGRIDRQTPALSVRIEGIDLLPTWRVPPGITRRDMIPKLASDPGYFSREGIQVLSASNGKPVAPGSSEWASGSAETLRFEQAPGASNALGLIRIAMPNKYVVYLHDTPKRELFAKPARPFSSGCVRTDKIAELALWLLTDHATWNANTLARAIKSGKSRSIKLTAPVPVHFVYLTAWVETDGDVNFREDIYRRDNASPGAELYLEHVVPRQPPSP
jgi:L,D-transpeptidase YcbB